MYGSGVGVGAQVMATPSNHDGRTKAVVGAGVVISGVGDGVPLPTVVPPPAVSGIVVVSVEGDGVGVEGDDVEGDDVEGDGVEGDGVEGEGDGVSAGVLK